MSELYPLPKHVPLLVALTEGGMLTPKLTQGPAEAREWSLHSTHGRLG
jgi:hypothetical protein